MIEAVIEMKKIILIGLAVILIVVIVVTLSLIVIQHGVESTTVWYKTDKYTSENVNSLVMNKDEDYRILVLL